MVIRTPSDYAQALLAALGMPVTTNNVAALVTAQKAEAGFSTNGVTEQQVLYNPLNLTQQTSTSHTAPGYGGAGQANIQAYASWQDSINAAVRFFQNPNGWYTDILQSLAKSNPPDVTLQIWAENPHYGWTLTPSSIGWEIYGESTFPTAGSVSENPVFTANPSTQPLLVRLGFGAAIAYAFYKALPMIFK
jgi:hypothetical protein